MNLWRTLALCALATSIACDGGKADDADGTDDTTPDTPVVEDTNTSTGSQLVDLEAISLAAEFGYDLTTDMTIEGNVDGNTFVPTLSISLGSEDYFAAGDDDEGCVAFATAAGMSPRATWIGGDMIWAFEFATPFTVDASGCDGILDMAEVDAVVGQLTASTFLWGIGVQEDLGEDAARALASADIDAIGGGFAGSWNATAEITEITPDVYDPKGGYVYAIALDETGGLVNDGSSFTNLTEAEMVVDGALQRGYYILGMTYYWNLQ